MFTNVFIPLHMLNAFNDKSYVYHNGRIFKDYADWLLYYDICGNRNSVEFTAEIENSKLP